MVFNTITVIVFMSILLIWAGGITYVVYRLKHQYDKLVGSEQKSTLMDILGKLLKNDSSLQNMQAVLDTRLGVLEKNGVFYLQRVGIERFNPFSDTGGNQSFTVALLDGEKNGIVMTSLYARSGNRWYIKQVAKGLGIETQLSKEEVAAIIKAKSL